MFQYILHYFMLPSFFRRLFMFDSNRRVPRLLGLVNAGGGAVLNLARSLARTSAWKSLGVVFLGDPVR